MTIPFWCLALGVLLPYFWAPFSFGERKARFGGADFRHPRLQAAQLEGTGARAMGAHANAFEALSVFAPAVVLAHLSGANPTWSAALAVIWAMSRVGHAMFYIADKPAPRTLSFAVGMLCALGLLVLSALA